MKYVITAIHRKKMAEATHTTGTIAKAKWIALGSGGVDSSNNIITPLEGNVSLNNEVMRKEYTTSRKASDTSYEYTIELAENELVGTYISEIALIDEDGDAIAFANFLPNGKDDTESTYTIEDNY